jgi:hypothetical protein
MGLYVAGASCRIGKSALAGKNDNYVTHSERMEFAVYNALCAVEEIAKYLEEQHHDRP